MAPMPAADIPSWLGGVGQPPPHPAGGCSSGARGGLRPATTRPAGRRSPGSASRCSGAAPRMSPRAILHALVATGADHGAAAPWRIRRRQGNSSRRSPPPGWSWRSAASSRISRAGRCRWGCGGGRRRAGAGDGAADDALLHHRGGDRRPAVAGDGRGFGVGPPLPSSTSRWGRTCLSQSAAAASAAASICRGAADTHRPLRATRFIRGSP